MLIIKPLFLCFISYREVNRERIAKNPRLRLQYTDSRLSNDELSRHTNYSLDYPCIPIIDLCYGDKIANATAHPNCCKITSPPLRRTVSAKQPSANQKPKITSCSSKHQQNAYQCVNPHICSMPPPDNIDNPCTIISSSTAIHRNISLPKNEYRTNIEDNCLNLNPYARKRKFILYI